jgi:hypothetical protein
MKQKVLRANLYIGLGLIVFSVVLLALSRAFYETLVFILRLVVVYFIFGWSLITDFKAIVAGLGAVKKFFLLAFLFNTFWCFFESASETSELELPRFACGGCPKRWLGYFFSYARSFRILKSWRFYGTAFSRERLLALFGLRAHAAIS